MVTAVQVALQEVPAVRQAATQEEAAEVVIMPIATAEQAEGEKLEFLHGR